MTWKTRLAAWLTRTDTTDTGDGPAVPARPTVAADPTSLIQVFRAVQVLQTAVSALPILQTDDHGIPRQRQSPLLRRPSPDMTRRELVMTMVGSLAFDGNLFLLRDSVGGMTLGVRPLPPQEVTVWDASGDPLHPDIRYSWRGMRLDRSQVIHKRLMVRPGSLRGLGPIASARVELDGAIATRDYASHWRDEAARPSGILSFKEPISDLEAQTAKERVMAARSGTPLVLGGDAAYSSLLMNPADLQFIETRRFDGTQIARLFGIPANLMLTGADGSSLTYQNIEQSWIEFASYTLTAYADPICEALGALLPDGSHVAMDWDSSRRSDTATRYSAYATAIGAGWMLPDEVRTREGLKPLTTDKESDQ